MFPVKFAKFLRTRYFEEHLRTDASAAQALFNDFRQKCITNIFRTLFNVFTTFAVA